MQNDKNMLLVKSIEKFPCLYNFNLLDYLKKDVTDEAWNEVANQTQLTVIECKEKWKNLRYGLLRSLRVNPDGTVKKKYYLHDEMEFVLPFIKTSKHETIIHPIDETGMDLNIVHEQDTERSPIHHYQELEITEPPKKKSRPNDTFIKKLQQNTAHGYDVYDDSRKMFLLSLLPEVNALNELQMRIFRRKVLSLIDEISDSPTQYDMCILEWQKDSVSQDSEKTVQHDIIKKEPL